MPVLPKFSSHRDKCPPGSDLPRTIGLAICIAVIVALAMYVIRHRP
jgi:hypothetical protein